MKKIKIGDKVKVYWHNASKREDETIRYGEVMGISENNKKLLLNERSEFATLTISQFHHCREGWEVIFLNIPNHSFTGTAYRASKLKVIFKTTNRLTK